MNLRLSRFEKTAGLFVGAALSLSIAGVGGVALKNGWFARKVSFRTELETAEGIHAGTLVQIAGLRVGAVTDVELDEFDHVHVHFEILEKFKTRMRADSRVQVLRPFLLSEKVLDVSSGSADAERLAEGASIPSSASTDLIDLLTGKRMGLLLASLDHLAESFAIFGEAFADPKRSRAMVKTFDRLGPTLDSLGRAAGEVAQATHALNRNERADAIAGNLALVARELGVLVPELAQEAPHAGRQLGEIVRNLNVLTGEFAKLTPDLPRTSHRAVEALDETVLLLKAMQKSFLFRGGVREVLDEEKRKPASEK